MFLLNECGVASALPGRTSKAGADDQAPADPLWQGLDLDAQGKAISSIIVKNDYPEITINSSGAEFP